MTHFTEHTLRSADNINIYYRYYPTNTTQSTSILCLPALTRNAKSFHHYATHITEKFNLPVICPDMRGRGKSDYDSIFMNYNLWTEANDILNIINHHDLQNIIIIGTSRGGMQAALLAGMIADKIKAVILNDIGATIPMSALERLKKLFEHTTPLIGDYQKTLSAFYTWDNQMTTDLTEEQESQIINSLFKYENGLYYRDYDYIGMGQAYLASFTTNPNLEYCDLKPIFSNLTAIPTVLLHGENSDILTDMCVMDTKSVIPKLEYHKFPKRGHVLYFNEPQVIDICDNVINRFL